MLLCDGAGSAIDLRGGTGYVTRHVIEGSSTLVAAGCEFYSDTTANMMEAQAIVTGMKHALELNISAIIILSDSKLVVNQINRVYRINNPRLIQLHSKVVALEATLNIQ